MEAIQRTAISGHQKRRPASFVILTLAAVISLAAVFVLSTGSTAWSLAPLAAVGLAALIWILRRARNDAGWLLCALLAIEVLASADFSYEPSQAGLNVARAAIRYGLVMLLCAPAIPRTLRSGILREGGFKLFCVYFAWAAVTITYSLVPAFSAGRLALSVVLFLALCYAVAQVESADDAYRLVQWLFRGTSIVVGVLVAAAVLLPHDITWIADPSGIDRYRGLLPSPNQIGEVMVTTAGAGLLCWKRATLPEKALIGVTVIASIVLAVMADSRSSFVAFGTGATAYLIWRYGLRGLLIWMACVLAIGTILVVHNHSLDSYVMRGNVATLTGRTEVWNFALGRIAAHPILGYGYEAQGAIFQSRFFPLWWGPWEEGPYSSIHNGYLSRMVGLGIPATLLWLWFTSRPIVFVLRKKDDPWTLKPIVLLALIPVLLENLAETTAGDCRNCTGILLFVGWALAERQRLMVIAESARERAENLARMPRAVAALSSMAVMGIACVLMLPAAARASDLCFSEQSAACWIPAQTRKSG
jgi:O-antigen ligase